MAAAEVPPDCRYNGGMEAAITPHAGRSQRMILSFATPSALAPNRDLLVAYLELLKLRLTGALLIPIPVLTEV